MNAICELQVWLLMHVLQLCQASTRSLIGRLSAAEVSGFIAATDSSTIVIENFNYLGSESGKQL